MVTHHRATERHLPYIPQCLYKQQCTRSDIKTDTGMALLLMTVTYSRTTQKGYLHTAMYTEPFNREKKKTGSCHIIRPFDWTRSRFGEMITHFNLCIFRCFVTSRNPST